MNGGIRVSCRKWRLNKKVVWFSFYRKRLNGSKRVICPVYMYIVTVVILILFHVRKIVSFVKALPQAKHAKISR